MVAMVLAIAVPAFAQILPQGESRVTDPVSDGGSVPEDVDTIPIKLSSELCADLTNPLVTRTFALVVPDLVKGCMNRASEPADPADTAVQRESAPSLTPSVNQAPIEEPGSVEPASGHLAELTDKTAPADTAAPADTTIVPSV